VNFALLIIKFIIMAYRGIVTTAKPDNASVLKESLLLRAVLECMPCTGCTTSQREIP